MLSSLNSDLYSFIAPFFHTRTRKVIELIVESNVVVAGDDNQWDAFPSSEHGAEAAKILAPSFLVHPLTLVKRVAHQEDGLKTAVLIGLKLHKIDACSSLTYITFP